MSQRKIKPEVKASKPQRRDIPGVPDELTDLADRLTLQRGRGGENYDAALQCFLHRLANSPFAGKKEPNQLALESVHAIITILGETFPRTKDDRPISIPEVAMLFGAVLGQAAAPAYLAKEVSLTDIEQQLEVLWISLREWLIRGYLHMQYIKAKGLAPSGLVKPA